MLQILRGTASELVSREDFYDSSLAVACGVGTADDLELRCIPRTAYSVNLFGDSECGHALFSLSKGEALPDNLVYLLGNALGGGTASFAIGIPSQLAKVTLEQE